MRAAACPVCARPQVPAYRPFCSRRCADVDLGRWLGGHYRLPGPPADEGDAPPRDGPGDGPEDGSGGDAADDPAGGGRR